MEHANSILDINTGMLCGNSKPTHDQHLHFIVSDAMPKDGNVIDAEDSEKLLLLLHGFK